MTHYPLFDKTTSFADYIARARTFVKKQRPDLQWAQANTALILNANSPFELYPEHPIHEGKKLKYGVLLIHGLLDSPFSLLDIGKQLQAKGMLCRSVLLPGHGTKPEDLLHVSYHDWIETVRFGIESLKPEVEKIFLIGYSTGAALSIYHAFQDPRIAKIVLLSPAISIKSPVDLLLGCHELIHRFSKNHLQWASQEDEVDYAKYKSIAFNPVKQVAELTKVIRALSKDNPLMTPMLMVMSHDDETVSCFSATDLFIESPNGLSQFILYTNNKHQPRDKRVTLRSATYPHLHIKNFSHVAIPFAPTNPHYGQHGDYLYASHSNESKCLYGAYNYLEVKTYHLLYQWGLAKQDRRELTYNPDFDFMAKKIIEFIEK